MKPYRESEGWKFYYSPEGYPYYFNDLSGVSEWATQDTYYLSIQDENSSNSEWNEHGEHFQSNQSSPKKKKNRIYSNNYDGSVDHNGQYEEEEDDENEDADDNNSEEEEEEEDEESGSSSLDEGLEKKFRQYLRTPEGIAAVLEEQDRIVKYLENTEKKKQNQREAQYLKSLFLAKKHDGDSSLQNKSKAEQDSVWKTTMTAAWSWLTEKPPMSNSEADSTKKLTKTHSKKSKIPQIDDYGRETVHRGKFSEGQDGDSNDIEDGPTATNGDNEDDEEEEGDDDESSLSSEDSDVAVIKAPLFSELPSWFTWKFFEDNLVQPSSQLLSRTFSPLVTTITTHDDDRNRRMQALWQSLSQQAWEFTVTAANITGQVSYAAIVGTYTRLEPYLIQLMEQIVDIEHNNTTNMQSNPLRRIEHVASYSPRFNPASVSPRMPPSSSSSSFVPAVVVSPRLPSTPRPEEAASVHSFVLPPAAAAALPAQNVASVVSPDTNDMPVIEMRDTDASIAMPSSSPVSSSPVSSSPVSSSPVVQTTEPAPQTEGWKEMIAAPEEEELTPAKVSTDESSAPLAASPTSAPLTAPTVHTEETDKVETNEVAEDMAEHVSYNDRVIAANDSVDHYNSLPPNVV